MEIRPRVRRPHRRAGVGSAQSARRARGPVPHRLGPRLPRGHEAPGSASPRSTARTCYLPGRTLEPWQSGELPQNVPRPGHPPGGVGGPDRAGAGARGRSPPIPMTLSSVAARIKTSNRPCLRPTVPSATCRGRDVRRDKRKSEGPAPGEHRAFRAEQRLAAPAGLGAVQNPPVRRIAACGAEFTESGASTREALGSTARRGRPRAPIPTGLALIPRARGRCAPRFDRMRIRAEAVATRREGQL